MGFHGIYEAHSIASLRSSNAEPMDSLRGSDCVTYYPHAQRERGKVIGRGVHIYIYIYICLWSKKKFESYFRDRLTFSNVDSRTSR